MISIIVPIYNAEKYLRECLESILNQSYTDFELILVNDGSTDKSLAICEEYKELYKRVILIDKENEGVSTSRNKGLDISKGELVCFVDADDILLPNALLNYAQIMEDTSIDIALFNCIRLRGTKKTDILSLNDVTHERPFKKVPHSPLWGYVYRKKIIDDNNIRFCDGLAYSEDIVFNHQYFIYVNRMRTCSSFVYMYRMNEQSACASKDYLRKSYHQFWAANILRTYSATGNVQHDFIRQKSQKLKELGHNALACSGMDFNVWNKGYKQYRERFEDTNKFIFILRILYLMLIDRRRKLINFKKEESAEI